jgi:hypothetical protein
MTKWLKRIWILGLIPLLFPTPFAGTARADAGIEGLALEEELDGMTVELVFGSESLKLGETELAVRIHDDQGNPVEGLNVTLTAHPAVNDQDDAEADSHEEEAQAVEPDESQGMDMGAEESQEPTEDTAESDPHAEGEEAEPVEIALSASHEGEYTGAIDFTTTGEWQIKIQLSEMSTMEHPQEVTFLVDVKGNGAKTMVLGGFLMANLSVIAVAAFLKFKPAAQPVKSSQTQREG